MATNIGIIRTSEITLTAATARTILKLSSVSGRRIKLLRWGLFFDGVTPLAKPVTVRLLRQSGGGATISITPRQRDDSISEALQTNVGEGATLEPASGDVLEVVTVHPQHGYEMAYPEGQEIIVGSGDELGIECTAPVAVNVQAKAIFEE